MSRARGLGHLRRNAVAYLALFVALGGTSYAASRLPAASVGTRQLRTGAVTFDKIRPTTRSALLAPHKGQTGRTGGRGPAGSRGPAGPAGASGVLAYAHVASDGTIVAGSAHGITGAQVFKKNNDPGPKVGIYCFRDLDFTPKAANVTSDGTPGVGALPIVTLDHAFTAAPCPKPYDVEVQMLDPWTPNTFVDSGFFIEFN